MSNKMMIFIDGENLLLRYQHMLGKGYVPRPNVLHVQDGYVWSPRITTLGSIILRISYYTTYTGDENKLTTLVNQIGSVRYDYTAYGLANYGRLCPHVFKKPSKSQKTASVDINITIDILRHVYNNSTDVVFLLSGDGDYLPLVQEVMRQGTKMFVGGFSDGLNRTLVNAADEFVDLDQWFFEIK